jgi:hypothetical protein
MAPEITMLWESEPAANGYRLKVSLVPKGGLTVALLERRTLVVRAKETSGARVRISIVRAHLDSVCVIVPRNCVTHASRPES